MVEVLHRDNLQSISKTPDANLKTYKVDKEEVQIRYENIMLRVMTLVEEISTLPSNHPSTSSGWQLSSGSSQDQPVKLTEDHNPVKFCVWVVK